MARPLRWSAAAHMLAELRQGPRLAAELRPYGDPVYTLADLNKQLARNRSPFRVRSRQVRVRTRWGRVAQRLYRLERIAA
jgi:hypothetical protein